MHLRNNNRNSSLWGPNFSDPVKLSDLPPPFRNKECSLIYADQYKMPPEEKAGRRGAGGGGGPRGGNRVEDNMFVHCTVHVYK